MKVIRLKSPAKINWWLSVGALRNDGYHALETVYQELDIADQMTIRLRQDDECLLSGFPLDIDPATNLVTKAWQVCRNAFPGQIPGVDIQIEKILPRGGGLGGGSSNAATVIRAINDLCDLGEISDRPHRQKLYDLAATIGSDVPFFITGATALGTGRGEIITRVPAPPRHWLVLVFPPASMPTGEAYRILDEIPRPVFPPGGSSKFVSFQQTLAISNTSSLATTIYNDFELVANKFGWYRRAVDQLQSAGAIRAFLCGSGSTVAGLCRDEDHARAVAALVPGSTVTHTI